MATTLPVRPIVAAGHAAAAAARPTAEVLRDLGVTGDGLTADEAERRLKDWGPNAVHSH
ncbi:MULTISPECIES: cation-transporting P-type ATPase [unclassified Streptomyces]|uniref:cation-transporting P-type ATPase n=1 Tax=unclassified Streptomyces TaxID=2593676 RepID=UPI003D8B2E9B